MQFKDKDETSMTAADNRRILNYLREHTDDMVSDLQGLIELESPTSYKPAVDALGCALAQELRELGGAVEVMPKAEVGDVVRARWNPGPGGVVILSHMDTVWDVGTVAGRPTRIEGDRIYGVWLDGHEGRHRDCAMGAASFARAGAFS